MATTEAAPRDRVPVSPLRQALRLVRIEFLQMYRYRTALFYVLGMPLIFALMMLNLEMGEPSGIDGRALNLVSFFALNTALVGVLHVSNIYAVRREQRILKRLRVSGVPPSAIFTATTLSVVAIVLAQCAVITALLTAGIGPAPAAPVLLTVGIVGGTVMMALLGALFTRFTRNAESTQMTNIIPFFLVVGTGGMFVPMDVFPEGVSALLSGAPLAPVTGIVRSAYFGRDLFSGFEGAEPATWAQLWAAAGPSLLLIVAWIAVFTVLLRFFRWDPRQVQ